MSTVFGLLLLIQHVSAQSLETNPPVEIKNMSGETRKICMHKDNTITLFAIGCVALKNNESIYWNRDGVFTPFKVRWVSASRLNKSCRWDNRKRMPNFGL